MIRALIFDCFGVLYNEGKAYVMKACPPDKLDELKSLYYQSDYGFLSRDDFIESIARLLDITPEEFLKAEGREYVQNQPLVEFIRRQKPQYKIGLLSNVGEDFFDSLMSPIEQKELFDEVVLSNTVGMVKPAREIYELIAARLEIPVEECVFIDDIPTNVEGAKIAGMEGILFTTNHQLELDLIRLLKVVNA